MSHAGADYIACILFDDDAFCRQIVGMLEGYTGKPLELIGSAEVRAILPLGSSL